MRAGKQPRRVIDQRVPGYNFDMAAGVTYEIDLTGPFGQRIQKSEIQRPAGRADTEAARDD